MGARFVKGLESQVFACSLANSHSGHTLLSLILDNHASLTHVGDTISVKERYAERIDCSCGKKTKDCYFWRNIYEWEKFDRLRWGFPGSAFIKAVFYTNLFSPMQRIIVKKSSSVREYAKILLEFSTFVTEMANTELLVYGRKRPYDVRLLLAYGVNVKVVHLTRHPMGFAASCRRNERKGHLGVEHSAKHWRRYNANVYSLQDYNSLCDYIHIPYELLCNDSEKTVSRLCSFLNVDYDGRMLNRVNPKEHHLIGADSLIKKPFVGIKKPHLNIEILTRNEEKKVYKLTQHVAMKLKY
jgi:hypothetical protein